MGRRAPSPAGGAACVGLGFGIGIGIGIGIGGGGGGASTGAAAAMGFFLTRGRRLGFGKIAFIERLIRFIVESTPITFTFTTSPTLTAWRASWTYLWDNSEIWTSPSW